MPYCTIADVKLRAVLLATLSGASDPEINAGIQWADNMMIDPRLASRYRVPINPVVPMVRELSADLAAYYVVFEKHTAGGEDEPVDAALELKNRALDLLKEIQNGKAAIPGVPLGSGQPPASSVLGSNPAPHWLKNFDLVNVPCTDQPPFAPYRRPW